MQTSSRLLTLAIAAVLAVPFSASAGRFDLAPATGRALGLLDTHGAAANRNGGDGFNVKDVIVDADGTEHVRFERTYRGLPVIGGDFVVHSRNGAMKGVSKTLKSDFRPNTNARVSGDDAIVAAGQVFGSDLSQAPTANKVIFARGASPVLAWEVNMVGVYKNGAPIDMTYFVDAGNGRILDTESNVHTAGGSKGKGKPGGGGGGSTTPAVGTGRTFAYGNVSLNTAGSGSSYNMTDTTRGGGATYDANNVVYSRAARGATLFTSSNNVWGDNTLSNRATSAADAHFGVATTWDYYKNVHGRNGIFNDGKGAKSYVHVGNNWGNAAWYQNAMYYGDASGGYLPFTALDIAGHEMSHGVTQATSGLAYSGDAGGLNEATSDIFGTMVEFYANNSNDAPDYLIGEGIYPDATTALRYMYDPNSDGNASYDCYPAAGFGGVDPHYSSGPANHFFYMLAEGTAAGGGMPGSKTCAAGDTKNATGNGSLAGIGRAKAEKVWYRALDLYFTSSTSYPGARAATIQAANDLVGQGVLTSSDAAAVAATWTAINVN